jgi:hypothetical protein
LPANANGKCQKWLLEHAGYDKAECLIWPFARGPEGYGRVQFRKKITAAHRAICILAHGEPSLRSLHAAHSCGNGYDGCVNPSHLRWASKKENEADKLIHNKHNRGQRHGAAKLTEKDVREIRALRGVLTQIEIAHIYGISPAYVCGLQAFRTWAWVK